jgi:hypothetical protein
MGVALAAAGVGAEAAEPPEIKVVLSLLSPPEDRIYYPPSQSNPPSIMMNISLVNQGPEEIMKDGWKEMEFWLLLRLYDEKNRVITSNVIRESTTLLPPPSRVFPNEEGVLVQGTLVELVGTGWSVSFNYDLKNYYSLQGMSGVIRAQAVIPASTFLLYHQTAAGTRYAPRYPDDVVKWAGSLKSNVVSFTLVGDADGDQYYYPLAWGSNTAADCDDANAAVHPGAVETGNNGIDDDCDPSTPDVVAAETGTVRVRVDRHEVGTGNHPGSTKTGLGGVDLRVYSKAPGSCAAQHGISWQHYKDIWMDCDVTTGAGTTATDGTAALAVTVGDHILIGRYDPDVPPVPDGDEIYMGVSVGLVQANAVVDKYLQLIVKFTGKAVPGKSTKKTGSELLIIEPEYVEWDGAQELYPFIFESVGNWTVTTSVTPPEGFVADQNSLNEVVNSELEAVQFTITDVGSEWKDTAVTYQLKHGKKTEKYQSRIGVKLTKELAKQKGVNIFGKPVEDEDAQGDEN